MANYPATLPDSTPADHGVVIDEIVAMAATPLGPAVPYVTGLWYSPPTATGVSSQTNSVGDVRLYRMDFPPGTTITGLAVNVATAGSAGATKTLLIYNDGGASMPTSLQKATSALATDSTGIKSETFSAEAVGGTRWFGTLTLVATSVTSGINNGTYGVGLSSLAQANIVWTGYHQTGQSSAPANFTTTRLTVNGMDRVLFQIG